MIRSPSFSRSGSSTTITILPRLRSSSASSIFAKLTTLLYARARDAAFRSATGPGHNSWLRWYYRSDLCGHSSVVERLLAKEEVARSTRVARSNL